MYSRLSQTTRTLIIRPKFTTGKVVVLRHSFSRPLRISTHHVTKRAFTSTLRTMASDEDYASFLEKANQDPSGGKASAQSSKKAGTKSVDTEVPKVLGQVDEYYTSDADEPFEPVSLKWKGEKLPSAGMLVFLPSRNMKFEKTPCGRIANTTPDRRIRFSYRQGCIEHKSRRF